MRRIEEARMGVDQTERGGGWLRSLVRGPRALLAAAIGAVVTAVAVGVVTERISTSDLADRLRFGAPPIGVTVFPFPAMGAVPGAASAGRLDTPAMRRRIDGRPVSELPDDLPLVAAHATSVLLRLRGEWSAGVDIVDMRVRVLRRGPLLTGTLLLGPGPQGATEGVVLGTTVDDPVPRLVQEGGARPYFATHRISLAHGESLDVTLAPRAAHASVEWDLAIDYVADGRTGTEHVGGGGVASDHVDAQPFAITATPPRLSDYQAVYWVDVEDPDLRVRLLTPDRYCAADHTLDRGHVLGC
jgi:hypothetical protein